MKSYLKNIFLETPNTLDNDIQNKNSKVNEILVQIIFKFIIDLRSLRAVSIDF